MRWEIRVRELCSRRRWLLRRFTASDHRSNAWAMQRWATLEAMRVSVDLLRFIVLAAAAHALNVANAMRWEMRVRQICSRRRWLLWQDGP